MVEQSTMEAPERQTVANKRRGAWERLPRRYKFAAGVGAVGLMGVGALAMIENFTPFNLLNGGIERHVEIEAPTDKVIKIDPINFGCFVQVRSEFKLAAHQREEMKLPLGKTQTIATNTTTAAGQGDTELCVDNKYTTISPVATDAAGKTHVTVSMGGLASHRPRIDFDNNFSIDENPSLAKRAESLGSGADDSIIDGLQMVAQKVVDANGCLPDAVTIAKKQIQNYYVELGKSYGVDETTVVFSNQPTGEQVPAGRIDDFLHNSGYEFSQYLNYDLLEGVGCSATTSGGSPMVSQG